MGHKYNDKYNDKYRGIIGLTPSLVNQISQDLITIFPFSFQNGEEIIFD